MVNIPWSYRWESACPNPRTANFSMKIDCGLVVEVTPRNGAPSATLLSQALAVLKKKPDTGYPLHTQEPVTVASFRTWRGWREYVARDRCLTFSILTSPTYSSLSCWNREQ